MDKESLGSKNHEELKQIQEDLNVEHYSSGSDNDNISETSLTVEDGTKDLMKNKEISGGDEPNQDLQNLANYFEKYSEDTDEEKVDENQDFLDQDDQEDRDDQNDQEDQNSASKIKVDPFLDLEENQDDVENNQNNEQADDKDSNNSSDDFIDMINPDPDKGIIEEEFDDTHYRLCEIIIRDYSEEYTFDLNVHRCIAKDASYQSMGIRHNKEPYMIIFTITKNFILTCEVNLEYYERKFTKYFEDLLRITHHFYFIGVTEENNKRFNRFWSDLSSNFYNNENKANIESDNYKNNNNIYLKSMIFIPYSPRATLSHVFTKEMFKTTVSVNILQKFQNYTNL